MAYINRMTLRDIEIDLDEVEFDDEDVDQMIADRLPEMSDSDLVDLIYPIFESVSDWQKLGRECASQIGDRMDEDDQEEILDAMGVKPFDVSHESLTSNVADEWPEWTEEQKIGFLRSLGVGTLENLIKLVAPSMMPEEMRHPMSKHRQPLTAMILLAIRRAIHDYATLVNFLEKVDDAKV